QRDVAREVDVRGDFENDAYVLVRKALIQTTNIGAQRLVDKWHLLTNEKLAQFIVCNVDLRLGQNRRVNRLLQELDEEIHAHRGLQHSRTQCRQGVSHAPGINRIDGGLPAEALYVVRGEVGDDRVIEVICRECFRPIG